MKKNFLNKGFTLVETIIVVVIFSLMVLVVIQLFLSMIQTKSQVEAKQSLIQGSYNIMEILNNNMQNYTLDYEEYFDRKLTGCSSSPTASNAGDNFKWNTNSSGYCSNFTNYGNGNSIISDTGNYNLYYCSSYSPAPNFPGLVIKSTPSAGIASGCYQTIFGPQSFGQYQLNYLDVKKDADGNSNPLFDDDDVKKGIGPLAIEDNTNVQELYLISKDKKQRLLIRRVLTDAGNYSTDPASAINKLYTLQMLRLKGYDAGSDHKGDYSSATDGTKQDGIIDTWACDDERGFICNGNSFKINGNTHTLPKDVNDGWVNMLDNNITLTGWNLTLYPVKDPKIAWGEDDMQLNPYFSISFSAKLFGKNWAWKYNPTRLDLLKMDLQTTFNTKSY